MIFFYNKFNTIYYELNFSAKLIIIVNWYMSKATKFELNVRWIIFFCTKKKLFQIKISLLLLGTSTVLFQCWPANPWLSQPFWGADTSLDRDEFSAGSGSFWEFRFVAFGILRCVSFFELSAKCNSMSSNDRFSVSGRILYIKISPPAITTQLNSATPGIESVVSKL